MIRFDTEEGVFYAKNVMIEVDNSNLEEGIDIFNEDMKYLTNVVGFAVDDENIEEIIMLNVEANA